MNFFNFLKSSVTKDVEGYENLQKRINDRHSYLESALHSFIDLNKFLKDFLKQIIYLNSKFTPIIKSPEEQPIHETCKLIYQKLINDLEQNGNVIDDYIKNLNYLLTKFNEEKNIYENLKKINKDLEEEKIKLEKNKDLYHKTGKEAENKIKIFVKNNLSNLSNLSPELKSELNNIVSNPIKAFDNYTNSIQRVNELVIKYNNTQNYLYAILPDLGSEDGVFFFRLVKLYFQCLENSEKYLSANKKQMNNSKTVETNSALKILIEENENKRQNETKVNLIQYQSDINFSKCKDKKEFDICAYTVDTINKYINKDIFKNFDYKQELKNYEVISLLKKLFEEKGEIDEEKEKKLLDSLNDESVHNSFIVMLSQLRTNNGFQKSKSLIKCLGKALNKLLDYAEKNKLYDYAKNCIILSQTYFYIEQNEKDKIYLTEEIKNNKWLITPEFWREFIDHMINAEFKRLERDTNFPLFKVRKNEPMPEEIKTKFNDVVFSQLLAYITNMMIFIKDKKIILKISDEFIKKYDYLSNSNLDTLFGIISNDKEEIERLRKEYNQQPSEQNIIHKDIEKEKESNEENKEDKKEDKEEEKDEEKEKEKEEVKEEKKEKKEKEEEGENNK